MKAFVIRIRAWITVLGCILSITFGAFPRMLWLALRYRGERHGAERRHRIAEAQCEWGNRLLRFVQAFMRMRVQFDSSALPSHPVIVIMYHTSIVDAFFVTATLWRLRITNVRWVAKEEVRWIPVIGWMCETVGAIFVSRRGGGCDKIAMQEGAARIRDDGASVMLFPDGTRVSDDDAPRDPRVGGFVWLSRELPDHDVVSVNVLSRQATGRTIVDGSSFYRADIVIRVVFTPRNTIADPASWLIAMWRDMRATRDRYREPRTM